MSRPTDSDPVAGAIVGAAVGLCAMGVTLAETGEALEETLGNPLLVAGLVLGGLLGIVFANLPSTRRR